MTTFVQAALNQTARTENGMKARQTSADYVTDLFFKIAASRGKDITAMFSAAYGQDRELALRVAQWARDVRGGAGERQIYRDIIKYLEKHNLDDAALLVRKAPIVGRWDDVLVANDPSVKAVAFARVAEALKAKDGLAAKWMPRKGQLAVELRNYLGMTPKQYRKTLVSLTKVVETPMCANEWDAINFSHVPSVAASRYRKAFYKHTPKYKEYVNALVTGKTVDGKEVKVNASSIYPYDVLKPLTSLYTGWGGYATIQKTEMDFITKQWEALPNYIGDANVLPLVDVSGSMTSMIPKSKLRCIDIALSLGLYCADKNVGKFKDTFLTFSSQPQLLHLTGNIMQKMEQMVKSKWEMNTNLHAAFDKILEVAVSNNVPPAEMPGIVLILSDMQFDCCRNYDDSAIQMIRRKYNQAGYEPPKVVFWNLNSYDNVPVREDEKGTALVSGFSPSIMKAILSQDTEQFTPRGIMLKTIMNPRYDLAVAA